MLNIGCHLSVSDGYEAICKEALSLGANTFQFFSRNPRGGKSAPLSPDDVKAMEDIMQKNSFAPVLAHASYTMNLCSADEKVRDFANRALKEDLEKFENMPCSLYNFHPGSHVGQGVEKGIFELDGHYYYAAYKGKLAVNTTIRITNTNNILVADTYTFNEYGQIIG